MIDTIKDEDRGLYADFDNRYLRRDTRFDIERDALKRLPVIDFSAFVKNGSLSARRSVARELHKACVDVGFFYLSDHGISRHELDEAITWGHRFFELPMEVKMGLHTSRPGQLGFVRIGGINPEANPDKAADHKERFTMSRELFPDEPAEGWRSGAGESRWPSEQVLPGFASFMKDHIVKRVVLARRLAQAFALSLDLPETFFDPFYRHLGTTSQINYYPPLDPATVKRTQWSSSPHTDYGAFTMLSQDSLGGLQVRNSAGEWIDVAPIPGTLVVNIGDLMATWTNDLYTSNLHRALNVAGKARISIPFFAYPQGASVIQCLDTCHGPGNPPRYSPVTAGEYVLALVAQADRTGRPGLSVRTAKRLST
jgi:isopenicillin N synthase-like dioxygenase